MQTIHTWRGNVAKMGPHRGEVSDTRWGTANCSVPNLSQSNWQVAIFELELAKSTLQTGLALNNCEFR